MSRPVLTVRIDPVNHSAHVHGHAAWRLLKAAGARPFWSRLHNTWVTTEKVAADVVAMAEADGLAVELSRGGLR